MDNKPVVGVLNEQGYFGTGFGFNEVTKEEAEKLEKEREKDNRK